MILVLKIAQYHSSAGNTREISNLKLGVSKTRIMKDFLKTKK